MSARNALIEEANELGLEFKGNISTIKLRAMVDEANNEYGTPPPVDEVVPPSPAIKADKPKNKEEKPAPLALRQRRRIQDAKKRALATTIVTITNKDNRENDVMTTVYLGFENQYFGLAKDVPLDIPVELEQALIDIAEKTTMTLHKDEVIEGRRTGNKVPVTVKKFAISYAKQQTK